MRKMTLAAALVLYVAATSLLADVNILVIGSTQSYDQRERRGAGNAALDVRLMADSLRGMLGRDPKITGTVNVVFEDVFRTKSLPTAVGGGGKTMAMEYHCHSLAQYYFWPEGRAERLANLSGAGGTKWNYVVLVGDAYILAHMPGVYAEGVALIADRVRKGPGKPVLVVPWPTDGTDAAHVGEAVYRVGRGEGIPVAPAGHARAALVKAGKASPTYAGWLAAACVYSEICGRLAPGTKAGQKALAALALKTVKANKTRTQFSGRFEHSSPFAMKYVTKKSITFNHTGTSSENGIQGPLIAAIKRCGVACRKVGADAAGTDFNYGRANTMFEPHKRYKVDPKRFGRSYGFPMQEHSKTAAETMLYGIDKRYLNGSRYDDGTDLGIAYDMIRQGEVASDIRAVPVRLMWAKLHEANPKLNPLRDRWHMSRYLDEATGTFMCTLLFGRCPVGGEPKSRGSDAWNRWLGRRIGYETAVRMAHLAPPRPGR